MSIARERCVRECISPSCYREIYEFDAVNKMFNIEFTKFSSNLFDLLFSFCLPLTSWRKVKLMFDYIHSKDVLFNVLAGHEIDVNMNELCEVMHLWRTPAMCHHMSAIIHSNCTDYKINYRI